MHIYIYVHISTYTYIMYISNTFLKAIKEGKETDTENSINPKMGWENEFKVVPFDRKHR